MKIFYIVAFIILISTTVRATQEPNPLISGLFSMLNSMPANSAGQAPMESQPSCLNTVIDLVMYVYEQLQSILAGKVVPDQMYLMVQGFVAMTKFNSAKLACFSQ
uniref:Uncharacterized protein n=1 Tax=Euplotes harpa TaxID=151035 RepID=A0A7S3N6Y4_9SPIT|eukprot:CAMPEP_0168325424 /NCGR_PEP_ID=MMETSP0213-20121227/4685_1 /TAXON_ID=151035 /ORGANISM="Euplotes harpa, Strain FSP1.4" /LENGTH=104 /DNA_ID=CAMNT_0008327917 /DNA_START=12 /DNA_END=326 /DNA_ORIENTATION=+